MDTSPQRLSDLTRQYEANAAVRAQTIWLMCRGLANIANGTSALDWARKLMPRSVHLGTIEKSATGALLGTDAGLDSGNINPLTAEWAGLVRRRTTLGQMGAALRNVPRNTPVTTVDTGTTATFVAEDAPIPAVRPVLSDAELAPTKLGIIVPISSEAMKKTADRAAALIERDIVRAVSVGEDTVLLDRQPAVTGERPASILNGLSPLGGGSPADVEADVIALLEEVRGGDAVAPFFITNPAGARYLLAQRDPTGGNRLFPNVTARGGDLYGVPLLVTTGAPNLLALADADAIQIVDEGLTLDSSREASFQFDTEPTDGAASQVSLFQSNAIAIMCVRYIGWRLAWSDGAAFIDLPVND